MVNGRLLVAIGGNMAAYTVVLMHHTVNRQWSVGDSLGGNMAAYTVALMHHTVNGQWSVCGSLGGNMAAYTYSCSHAPHRSTALLTLYSTTTLQVGQGPL